MIQANPKRVKNSRIFLLLIFYNCRLSKGTKKLWYYRFSVNTTVFVTFRFKISFQINFIILLCQH